MSEDCASRYWEGWLEDLDKSEGQLRNYTLTLVKAAHAAAHDSDFSALGKINAMYLAGESLFPLEPYISTYEAGKFMIQLIVADCCCLNSRHRHAWDLSEEVLDWLKAADQRRVEAQIGTRGNSEVRVIALGVQAAGYFEQPELSSPAVMESKTREFWKVATGLWVALEKTALRPEYILTMRQLVSIYELAICRACIRLGREWLEQAVSNFNARHGHELYAAERHFLSLSAADAPTSFYWDLEYCKLFAAADARREDLTLCARNRLTGARLRFGAAPLDVLVKHWRQQQLASRH